MKISKIYNGNVLLLNSDDTVIKSYPAERSVQRHQIDNESLVITDFKNYPVKLSEVTDLIVLGVSTTFTGDINDLMLELATNFFYKVPGGGARKRLIIA